VCEEKKVRRKRNSPVPKSTLESKRKPVNQRWYYEPVLESALVVHQLDGDEKPLVQSSHHSGLGEFQDIRPAGDYHEGGSIPMGSDNDT
jgi:hypothetical protein